MNELARLLSSNLYINLSWVNRQDGYAIYDTVLIDAVQRFQDDASLPHDGVNEETLQALRLWDTQKTTVKLGVRNLRYSPYNETSGADVDELILLLFKAGYGPDRSKLVKKGEHYVMTEDVSNAIRRFQEANSLVATGIANEKTIEALKK